MQHFFHCESILTFEFYYIILFTHYINSSMNIYNFTIKKVLRILITNKFLFNAQLIDTLFFSPVLFLSFTRGYGYKVLSSNR